MNSMGVCKMDNGKVGELIRRLRKEKNMTQLQLAEQLHVSDKAVSKWERGMGSPELSLIAELSRIFAVDMENLLAGELKRNELMGGNMRKLQFYVCPDCGNLLTSMTDTDISCCGRKLKAITPVKAAEEEKLSVEHIEQDLFISSDHEMSREHYITFCALMTGDTLVLKKLYPEWDLQTRLPALARGKLFWYCNQHGLFYQVV